MTGLATSNQDKAQLLDLPYVSGITSYVTWRELEPVKNQFDFNKLDADIALARSRGKKVSIAVFTGKNSIPDWVVGEGVRTWVTSQGNTLIHPADGGFVTLWSSRVQALGARYGADSTVVQVAICGAAGTLCGPRYPELPNDVTYAQLLSHWASVIAAYEQAFPATYKHLEVHLSQGFDARLPVDLAAGVDAQAAFGPFAEFLSDVAPADGSVTGEAFSAIAKTRDWCGFQMVSPLDDKVGLAVQRGRDLGCNYFEIYGADLRQQGAILSALQ
jgi:hypothetical protein